MNQPSPAPHARNRREVLRAGVSGAVGLTGLVLVGCAGGEDSLAPLAETAPAPAPTPPLAATPPPGDPAASAPADPIGRRLLDPRRCDGCSIADPAFDPLPGARAVFGIADGAAYRIEVPDNWNGTLVLWGHGFQGLNDAGTGFTNVLGFGQAMPGRELFVPSGVAWAASTYRATGYVPAVGVDDLLAVKDIFRREVGEPKITICVGVSMGGATAQLMAQEFPEEIVGAIAFCGALSNVEVVDYFASWYALALWFLGTLRSRPRPTGSSLGRIPWAA